MRPVSSRQRTQRGDAEALERRRRACARACRSSTTAIVVRCRRMPADRRIDRDRRARRRRARRRGIRASRVRACELRARGRSAPRPSCATTSSPLVSLSRRCTMPARGSAASAGAWCSSAFSSVPSRLPLPGCTTRPAGLSSTMSASSSCTIVERDRPAAAIGERRRRRPPARRRRARRRATRRFAADDAPSTRHVAGVDPALQAAARMLRHELRERLVEAQARERRRHRQRRRRTPPGRRRRRQRPVGYNSRDSRSDADERSCDGRGWRVWLACALRRCLVAGCSLLPDVKDETASWSAEKLYSTAHDAMMEGQLYAGDQAVRDARVALSRTAATRSRRFSKARSRTGAPTSRRPPPRPATASSARIPTIRTSTTRTT